MQTTEKKDPLDLLTDTDKKLLKSARHIASIGGSTARTKGKSDIYKKLNPVLVSVSSLAEKNNLPKWEKERKQVSAVCVELDPEWNDLYKACKNILAKLATTKKPEVKKKDTKDTDSEDEE